MATSWKDKQIEDWQKVNRIMNSGSGSGSRSGSKNLSRADLHTLIYLLLDKIEALENKVNQDAEKKDKR